MLIEQCPGLSSVDVTTHRDSYAWNYRELVTLLILGESLVMSLTSIICINVESYG